ncbi:MAG TPA: NAD-dependent epimerase/dehydratase family protein [Solirubrobacteraceae bacterium]|nr:NAD-dependent epimerase/dehydratase family protein [Solirubrobacteraceae bacterium]
MRTAFVTGGSGFIGGRLVERLARDGWTVRALARSDAAAARVEAAGATAVRGDLDDPTGLEGAEVVFHVAALAADWGAWRDFRRVNVEGTRNVLAAARAAGVRRVVHVGTEAALMHGQPLVLADERTPLAFSSPAPYPATKAEAEAAVVAANGGGLETIVVRPRFVWGPGDTTLMPVMVEMVRSGRFRWIGGGRQLTSTTHVDNCVEGLVLAADRGTPGAAYFVTDGEPVAFREFVTALLATRGVTAPDGSVPRPLARAAARAAEAAWRLLPLPGAPPLTRFAVWVASLECTLDDSRARDELGYEPPVARDDGLAALSRS